MAKKPSDQDVQTQGSRIDELEIKVSFLEKELEEYKDASRGFYRRMADMEEELRKLNREIPESSLPAPEVTWDAENHSVRP
ncbi:MAG TPA: hypothetical protein VJ385_06755 [Fibrobacteria bacterium]|nr:hypothetical protein [Fibrobacteria bacterium]